MKEKKEGKLGEEGRNVRGQWWKRWRKRDEGLRVKDKLTRKKKV
jgi:hypothetical protein